MKKCFIIICFFIPIILFPQILVSQNGSLSKSLNFGPSGTWTKYTGTDFGFSANNVKDISIDAGGNKWLAVDGTALPSDGGIAKFDGTSWTAWHKTSMGITNSNNVSYVETDNAGYLNHKSNQTTMATRVWATTGGGLSKYVGSAWSLLTSSNGLPSGYFSGMTICIYNYVWMAINEKLVSYNGSTFTTFTNANIHWIMAVLADNAGNIWVATSGTGLYRFSGGSWFPYSSPFSSSTPNCLAKDQNGNIWAGDEVTSTIGKFDGNNWTSLTCPIGSRVNGIAIEGTAPVLNSKNNKDNKSILLAGNNIWVATNAGLAKYDGTIWTIYTTANTNGGLPSDNVNCIVIDGDGKKWIGTNAGLAVFEDVQTNNPKISISSTNVGFGNANVNSTIDSTVTISNTGTAALTISQTSIIGADTGSFSIINGGAAPAAPITITPGGTHNIVIRFNPKTYGNKTASVRIIHNAAGSPSSINLSGTGTAPGITVNSNNIYYGSIYVGSSSDQNVVITNSGNANLVISALTIFGTNAGMFKRYSIPDSSSIPITITPGSSYTIKVRFSPENVSNKNATLQIVHNAGTPTDISLSGKGVGMPIISLSTNSLSYGNVNTGSSKTMNVIIQNQGTDTLVITGVNFSGADVSNFSCSDVFPIKIKPVEGTIITSVSLSVKFIPASAGSKTGTLQILHNAGSPSSVSLSGNGLASGVSINTTTVDYGVTGVNQTQDINLTIRNTGTALIRIDSLNIVGSGKDAFRVMNQSLPINLNPSDSSNIKIRFTPIAIGTSNATLRIISNDPVTPLLEVALSGKGVKPVILVSDSIINFGTLNLGDSTGKAIRIYNGTQEITLRIDSIYLESNNGNVFIYDKLKFPINIAVSSFLELNLSFLPKIKGLFNTNLVILSSDYSKSPVKIQLSGKATLPNLTFNKDSIYIETHYEYSKDTTIYISNNGDGNLIISNINVINYGPNWLSIEYFKPNTVIEPGKTDSVIIRIRTTSNYTIAQSRYKLEFQTNIYNNKIIDFIINAKLKFPKITCTSLLDFGKISFSSSKSLNINVSNSGESFLQINKLSFTGKDSSEFKLGEITFPFTIDPNKNKDLLVTFTPKAQGTKEAGIEILSNDFNSPKTTVKITAEAIRQYLTSNLAVIDYGKLSLSYTKDSILVLQNQGTESINITNIEIKGLNYDQFSIINYSQNTTFPLAPGAKKELTVRYSPVIKGAANAQIEITSTDQFNPKLIIQISGEGLAAKLSISSSPFFSGEPKMIDLGYIPANCRCAVNANLTFKNEGQGILQIKSLSLTGDKGFQINNSEFNTIIGSGKSDSFSVSYLANTEYGTKKATLLIKTNDPDKLNDSIIIKIIATKPSIELSATSIDFNTLLVKKIKDFIFKIRNKGDYKLSLNKFYITSGDSVHFKVFNNDPNKTNLDPGDSAIFTARFEPLNTGKKTSKIIIENSDYLNDKISINITGVGIIPDIINESSLIANLNEPKQISFSLDNSYSPIKVKVFYKLGGELKYDSSASLMPVSSAPSFKYNYTFPKEIITMRGLDYYIIIGWENGVEATLPKTNYLKYPLTQLVRVQEISPDITLYAKRYSMLSIPFQYENNSLFKDIVSNFGPVKNTKWRVFRWRYNNYEELINGNDWSINSGDGFWVITKYTNKLTLKNLITNPTNTEFKIKLSPGWNQIGIPYVFWIPASSILIPNGKHVENTLFEWNIDDLDYSTQNIALNPWTGYFINNRESDSVEIMLEPVKYQGSMAKDFKYEPARLSKNEWKINILAELNNKKNGIVEFGCLQNSRDEWDVYDAGEPPVIDEDYLSVRIINSKWTKYNGFYVKDFRQTGKEGYIWEIELFHGNSESTDDKSDGKISLIPNNLPENFLISIYDYDKASVFKCPLSVINEVIKAEYSFTFDNKQKTKKLKITVGTNSFIESELSSVKTDINDYTLSQNYPNPFNPSTRIEYTIPENSHVILKVFNSLGQEVTKLIDEQKTPGKYFINFKADEYPSGIYYYKIQAGRHMEVKKMIYLR